VADDRMYTIPGGVQSEAKKALEWHFLPCQRRSNAEVNASTKTNMGIW